jgi:D-amino-acid oxidase
MSSFHKPSPVVLGKDISLDPYPLKSPSVFSPRILVVGGGVTGLVTSWVLLDLGYRVTVVSKDWASYTSQQRLTSQIAGALWEYPPAVCGQHTDAVSLQHSKQWSLLAYDVWSAVAEDEKLSKEAGVRMRRSDFFFRTPLEQDEVQYKKMVEIQQSRIKGFVRGNHLIRERGINPEFPVADAYEILVPVIDTDQAMTWLMNLVRGKGATFITEAIRGDLLYQEDALLRRFDADVIINATGLAAAELAGDESCYPIRGCLLRVVNDGTQFPQITDALAISADTVNEIIFIVPRNDNILLMGGCAEPHEWNLDATLNTPIVKRMRDRAEAFLPQLKHAKLDPDYPLAQGLRPFRQRNVRVERESRERDVSSHVYVMGKSTRSRIIHSYGQGGAGWSLSFGCAGDVALMVRETLLDSPVEKAGGPSSFRDTRAEQIQFKAML